MNAERSKYFSPAGEDSRSSDLQEDEALPTSGPEFTESSSEFSSQSAPQSSNDVESVTDRSKSRWTQVDTPDAWTDSEDIGADNAKFFRGPKEETPSNSRTRRTSVGTTERV